MINRSFQKVIDKGKATSSQLAKKRFKVKDNEDSLIDPYLLDPGDVVSVEQVITDALTGKTITVIHVGTVKSLDTVNASAVIVKSEDDKEVDLDFSSSTFYWLFSDDSWEPNDYS